MPVSKYLKFLVPAVTVVIGFVVANYFSSFRESFTPRHWLADVQYSHIAITENFQKGEGSIFYPKSYLLDPSGGGSNQTHDGLTEARFPIIHWFIAKVSSNQTEQIIVWRSFSKVFYLLSILFAYLIMFRLTKHWVISLISALGFSFTSVALFAQDAVGTFTITYALLFIASYFFLWFLQDSKKEFLFLALGFSAWASLQGHGAIIFLLTIYGCYYYRARYFKENESYKIIASSIFGIGLVLFLYNRVYLYLKNGGLFEIGQPLDGGLKNLLDTNSKYLFSQSYNVSNLFINSFIFIGVVTFFYLLLLKKIKFNQLGKIGTFISIVLIANLSYFIIYLPGLFDKDLYLMESFLPSIILTSMFSVAYIYKRWPYKKIFFISCLSVVFLLSLGSVTNAYQYRFVETKENRIQKSLDNLENAAAFLDKLNISKEEKISLINGYGGNMSLMKTGRKGYVSEGSSIEDFKRLLSHKDSKYILSQDQFFMYDVVNAFPQILGKIQLVATNETLSLYKKRTSKDSTSGELLIDYLQCHNKTNFKLFNQGFEANDTNLTAWTINGNILNDSGYYSKRCLEVLGEVEFPGTLELNLSTFDKIPKGVVITGMFYTNKELRKVCFNTSCHKADEDKTQYFVEEYKVSKKLKGNAINHWTRVSCKVTLPDNIQKDDLIKIYLWNPNKGELVMDDFSFILY